MELLIRFSFNILLITAKLHKVYEHILSCYFCSASFFFEKFFKDLFMTWSHPITKNVHALVCLSIAVYKILLLSPWIKVPHKIPNHYTNLITRKATGFKSLRL